MMNYLKYEWMVLIAYSSEQLLCIPFVLLVSAEVGCEVDHTVAEELLFEGGEVSRGSGEACER